MNASKNTAKKMDTKVLLSTLWIVVMINMLKADILSLFIPGATEELAKTSASTGTPIPQLMLAGAIMMEIAIVMIILSRVLKYRVNRWVNIITSIITIAFVVGGGVSYPHYIFIATVEVVCLWFYADLWGENWTGDQLGLECRATRPKEVRYEKAPPTATAA